MYCKVNLFSLFTPLSVAPPALMDAKRLPLPGAPFGGGGGGGGGTPRLTAPSGVQMKYVLFISGVSFL